MAVESSLSLLEGRAAYFSENGLPPDGGYSDNWVVIKVGPVPVFLIKNTAARKRDVPFYDLHHVLTGYETTIVGEGEIGAWELGSDCTASPVAVLLNCQVFGTMLLVHPRRMFQAFMRGRRARNLYGTSFDEELLSRSIAEVREELCVDAPVGDPTTEDRRAFWRWSARAILGSWGPAIPILGLVWWFWG